MEKTTSRRKFLKFCAVATGVAVAAGTAKKTFASDGKKSENEVLYRETEHFKKYYETLK
jgi:hypothetical protein